MDTQVSIIATYKNYYGEIMQNKIISRLEFVQKEKKLNDAEFAINMNITRQTFYKIKNNKRLLHIDQVISLKENLNINPNFILLGEGQASFIEELYYFKNKELFDDFYKYDGTSDILKQYILAHILDKLYAKKTFLVKLGLKDNKYGNKLHCFLIKVLKENIFVEKKENAKIFLKDAILKSPQSLHLKEKVQNELIKMLENLDQTDCYYILQNRKLTIDIIYEKINKLDRVFMQDCK